MKINAWDLEVGDIIIGPFQTGRVVDLWTDVDDSSCPYITIRTDRKGRHRDECNEDTVDEVYGKKDFVTILPRLPECVF